MSTQDMLTGVDIVSRQGNLEVDEGGHWYFEENPEGYWLELDVGHHASCVYVCMRFEGGTETPFGQAVMNRIKQEEANG